MGNQKQKWTSEEEEALKAGVRKHGTGKWKNILKDPEFAPFLTNRSNIDLKDKWRNMSSSTAAQGSRDKFRMPRAKAITAGALANSHISGSVVPMAEDDGVDDPSKSPQDVKNAPRYNAMIFEALSSIKDSNGSDIGAIVGFIEVDFLFDSALQQRHEVPQNFRRLLSTKLRRLVLQGKLEKASRDIPFGLKVAASLLLDSKVVDVQNCYKIKDAALGTKTPTPKQKDVRPKPVQNSGSIISSETVKDAAMAAAYKVAEAENKSFVAAEAVKEAERVSKMAEDTEAVLQLVKEIYEQCSRGGIVLLA